MATVTLSQEVASALRAMASHPALFDDSGSTKNTDGTVTMRIDDDLKVALGNDPDTLVRTMMGLPPRRVAIASLEPAEAPITDVRHAAMILTHFTKK